jgi:ABC-2 type transport system ATP-binding protein
MRAAPRVRHAGAVTDSAVLTRGLCKAYRSGLSRRVALRDVDLDVPRGGVHALVGPEGSGRTTLLRVLLGLARPTAGEAALLGVPVPSRLAEVLPRVGAVVDQPAFTDGLTARRNLLLLARTSGVGRRRVDEVLERVGLSRRDHRRVARWSAGRQQRLGLAAALLGSPDLLLLDEPTAGLDPVAAEDLRRLLRELAEEGTTVVLASHDLDEVRGTASTLTVLDAGVVVASGTVDALLGESVARTRVRVADPMRAAEVLRTGGYDVTPFESDPGGDLLVAGHEHPEEISRLLAGADLFVAELTAARPGFRDWFGALTAPGAHRAAAPTEEESR